MSNAAKPPDPTPAPAPQSPAESGREGGAVPPSAAEPRREGSFVGSAGLTLLSFVVQFCGEANLGEGRLCGRVEHVRSGDASHFRSLDELLAFMKEAIDRGRVV